MTDETVLPTPTHAPAAVVEPADVTEPVELPVGTTPTPYRSSSPAVVAPAVAQPKTWPVVGLSLWVYGVATWSFVVMGELVTSYGPGKRDFLVGEGAATLLVLASAAGAWGVAFRRSLAMTPVRTTFLAVLRGGAAAFLAFALWAFIVVFAAAVGDSSSSNVDGKITVVLGLMAAGAAFAGRRLAGLHRHAPTPRQRAIALALWTGAGLLTILALAEIIAGD